MRWTGPAAAAHDEVVAAFRAIGNPRYGASVAADRKSNLEYLGLSVPQWRSRTKQGFSFYSRPSGEVLAIWDELWRTSPYGEVLFAALAYYRKTPKRWPPRFWELVRGWLGRVDNWSHADELAGLYSEVLERQRDAVYPQLQAWNSADRSEWERRVSLVSLIHYSGKNAVFMPLELVLPLVTNCLADRRYYVQNAVGWVLREMGNACAAEIRAYLEANIGDISAQALSRATERFPAPERSRLRELRRPAR